MRIDELIQALQKVRAERGNLVVFSLGMETGSNRFCSSEVERAEYKGEPSAGPLEVKDNRLQGGFVILL